MAEYIYIANPVLGQLESKTVVLEHGRPHSVDALPSVELQTETGEVYLQPRSIYADPLRGGEHILVLCEAFVPPQVRCFFVSGLLRWQNLSCWCGEQEETSRARGLQCADVDRAAKAVVQITLAAAAACRRPIPTQTQTQTPNLSATAVWL